MTGVLLAGLLDDLAGEGQELDDLVTSRPAADWSRPTPAAGWTVAHQIAHLAWTDELSLRAATEPAAFRADRAALGPDVTAAVDAAAAAGAAASPRELLARWRAARTALVPALTALPAGQALPWFGPDMSVASMVTARLMETWAHGVDVRDTLGQDTRPTTRLRAIAHLGVRTRAFSFRQHSTPPPTAEIRVVLTAPGGDTWSWGPEQASQEVAGPALDFCFLVTQRRHREDLALRVTGADADRWLDLAQAFAGPPGPGRRPGDHRPGRPAGNPAD